MTAIESRLTPPRPVEIVPADEAGAIIDGAHRELSALESRAAQARSIAEETRARAQREGADERASAWAIVRLQRFLDDLRAEAEHDARVVVTAARRRASTELDPIVDEPTTPPIPAVEPAVVVPTAPAPVVAPAPPVLVVPEPPPEPEPVPDPESRPTPTVSWVPPVADAPPATNGDHHAATFAGDVIVAAPVDAPADAVPVPVTAAVPMAFVPAAPAPVPAHAVEPAPRRKFLRGFPLSAALEVLAVLLVLAFILLRLS